jgi:hypothetical protein
MEPEPDPDPWIRTLDKPADDPDSDPALFVSGFQETTKISFNAYYPVLTVGRVHLHQSFRISRHQVVTKELKLRFFIFFCSLIEGSGSGSIQIITDPGPGGPKTYRSYTSGSGTQL